MAAKSAGMPCPDYNRLHEGFKVAYTEMARQYPCFGFYNDAKHWWWRACVQYLFVKVKPFYKYGTWCLFFYVETWEGLVIQLLYNLFCSAGGLWLWWGDIWENLHTHLFCFWLLCAICSISWCAPLPKVGSGEGTHSWDCQQCSVTPQRCNLASLRVESGAISVGLPDTITCFCSNLFSHCS